MDWGTCLGFCFFFLSHMKLGGKFDVPWYFICLFFSVAKLVRFIADFIDSRRLPSSQPCLKLFTTLLNVAFVTLFSLRIEDNSPLSWNTWGVVFTFAYIASAIKLSVSVAGLCRRKSRSEFNPPTLENQ